MLKFDILSPKNNKFLLDECPCVKISLKCDLKGASRQINITDQRLAELYTL